MKKILLIQTSFIGDVILATPLIEKLYRHFPDARIDFLLRKGNRSLFDNHPFLHEVLVWNKKKDKYRNLLTLIAAIRSRKYDMVVNLQRFLSTGLVTVLSGATQTVGFDKNPLSFLFKKSVSHQFGAKHEVERNLSLIDGWTDKSFMKPVLYPSPKDFEKVAMTGKYITIAPASVWFTKQLPLGKWIEFISRVGEDTPVLLLGGMEDVPLCEFIVSQTTNTDVRILAGTLSFLESAALMKGALMNYVNDSAPLHLASAVNAPVTAIFCSTVPDFGFTPLSDDSTTIETREKLSCRPCGLHGKKACPEGHFKCSNIDVESLLLKLG